MIFNDNASYLQHDKEKNFQFIVMYQFSKPGTQAKKR